MASAPLPASTCRCGCALLYFAEGSPCVALPEVIRLEVEHHLRKDLTAYVARIKDNYERLLAIFGTLKEIVLPSESDIEQKVSEAFAGFGLHPVPKTPS